MATPSNVRLIAMDILQMQQRPACTYVQDYVLLTLHIFTPWHLASGLSLCTDGCCIDHALYIRPNRDR